MTSSRRPILKKNVEAFVPSPRFLSESPARQPSSSGKPAPHISRPGQSLPQHMFSPSPSARQLRSPVPPPPANLFAGNPSAFNVDPGIPFLATVGPSDAGNSDKGSINEGEPTKRFVGGFVTGLKKALTIKGSRRQRSNYPQAVEDMHPTIVRDSGYATSNRPEDPPENQPPLVTTFPPPRPAMIMPVTSKSPPNHIQAINDDQIYAPAAASAPHDIVSLDSMASAVTAAVEYGPDYVKMDRHTPPHSDVSLTTYKTRVRNFVRDLVALPWIANERVTIDYYPVVAGRRGKRLSHRPAIVWRSRDYNRADYHLDFESESSSLKKVPHHHIRASSRTSHTDIDLDAEFPDQTYTPLPYHPPIRTNISDTLPLFPPNNGPVPDMSHVDAPRSGLQLDGNLALSKTPPTRKNPSLAPRSTTPSTLPLFPPDFGQIPNTYTEESHLGSPNLVSETPSARKPSIAQRGDPAILPPVTDQMPSHSVIRSNGQRPGSRNDVNRTFSNTTPIRHRPASVQSSSNTKGDPFRTTPRPGRRWESTPKAEHAAVHSGSPPIPETPFNRPPGPGSPSKRSQRSQTPTRRPHHEGIEGWDQYRPGYVPFERSENFYGNRYGVGIHGSLPPVTRVSSAASTVLSIKQPQPQYPTSTLVTPPSRSGSSSRALYT